MRSFTFALLCFVWLLLLVLSPLSAREIRCLGLMAAMDFECDYLLDSLCQRRTSCLAGREFHRGLIYGNDTVVVCSGIGKVNAAMTAQLLITHYRVDAIIMVGVAGGLGEEIEYGDVVIAKDLVQHDYSRVYPDRTSPGRLKIAKDGKWQHTKSFGSDADILKKLRAAAARSDFGGKSPLSQELPEIFVGKIATGDQFIASREVHRWIIDVHGAIAVEMESAAMAQVAETFSIPFGVVRAISDVSNSNSAFHYHLNKGRSARHAQQLILNYIYDGIN